MPLRPAQLAMLIGLILMLPMAQTYAAGTSVVLRLRPGIGIPTGDFADESVADAGNGLQVGGGLEILTQARIALGIEGGWMRNTHGSEGETVNLGGGATLHHDEDRFTTTHFGASAKYMIPSASSKVHPSVQLGLGRYSMKEKWVDTITDLSGTMTQSGEDDFGSRFGWRLGLGADYDVSPAVGIGLDVGYTSISMDEDTYGSSRAPFISIAGVLSYTFSKSE